ncbi:phospholipase A2 inhibitor and Ly6/PLAUR domain-containing protein-like isoform X2 [Clarias gariepinus]|uniref:phospholipase A2 inhibitor and Ly6/PLAUR domain-containing protein-like isoform X2 n=1 Tax=Clarias gariepinus TaxID=13013 RepID=UPI00234D3D99|nr:phospholipase A2 inhibitor and Ly6/PLAUR domain-containing protein-like isoform X2 [Clarias gariepinus]
MKLLLALYLLSFFFYSVSMLQCLKCKSKSDQCIDTLTQQCGPDEICGSAAFSINLAEQNENKTEVIRECVKQEVCDQQDAVGKDVFTTINGEMGNGSFYWSCCESDNCNNITITFPEPDTRPNGLKCLTCNSYTDRFCNSTVPCVGNQDHCLTFKVLFFLGMEMSMGCISKALCDASESFLGPFKCCSGNLCNKMQSLDHSKPQN